MTDKHDLNNLPFDLTETDRENLASGDENFKPHTWEEIEEIIATNNLSILKRKPSDLLRYIHWTNATKSSYGSITNFVLQERLFWTPLPASPSTTTPNTSGPRLHCTNPIPFASPDDYKILRNDWPYGFEAGIVHLIAWSKVRLPESEMGGHLTEEGRGVVEAFVRGVVMGGLGLGQGSGNEEKGEGKVLWFRNWTGLQSVKGLEHVHVLVRGVEGGKVEGLVG